MYMYRYEGMVMMVVSFGGRKSFYTNKNTDAHILSVSDLNNQFRRARRMLYLLLLFWVWCPSNKRPPVGYPKSYLLNQSTADESKRCDVLIVVGFMDGFIVGWWFHKSNMSSSPVYCLVNLFKEAEKRLKWSGTRKHQSWEWLWSAIGTNDIELMVILLLSKSFVSNWKCKERWQKKGADRQIEIGRLELRWHILHLKEITV